VRSESGSPKEADDFFRMVRKGLDKIAVGADCPSTHPGTRLIVNEFTPWVATASHRDPIGHLEALVAAHRILRVREA
jgi:hypothetical protein